MEIVPKKPRSNTPKLPKAPKHLCPATKRWWKSVVSTYELEPHHIRLLQLAAESWDRGQQAREILDAQGLTFVDDKLNRLTAHPCIAVERDCRLSFARLLRELDLDVEPTTASSRPPALRSNRR
jgi:phage terminase small subunit